MHIAITSQSGSLNRGCEALIQSLLLGLKAQGLLEENEITLHTGDLPFDSWRFGDKLKCIASTNHILPGKFHTKHLWFNKMSYRGLIAAERLLLKEGSTKRDFSTCADADLILFTGGDDLSMDYGGFYKSAAWLNLGRPSFLCSLSIGPFPKREELYFKKSIKDTRFITVRESLSYNYMKELNLPCPVEQTADVAFLLPTMKREETLDFAQRFFNVNLEGRKLAGLSASELITRYYKYGREDGVKQIARFVDRLNADGYSVVLIPHVMEKKPRSNDLIICGDILRQTKDARANILLSGLFSSIEVKSIIGLCDVLIGARTHATIASLSQGIPTVAIAYSRKAYGIIEDFYGADLGKKLIVPADKVYEDSLMEATKTALAAGRQDAQAARMKQLAMKNFEFLAKVVNAKE